MMIDRTVLKNNINNYFDRIIECANDDGDNEFATILGRLKDSVIKIIRNQPSVKNFNVYEPGCFGCEYENSNICEDCSFKRKE